MAKFPEISNFFHLHDSRHVNAASRKSVEIQSVLYCKTKNPFEAKLCMKISFQLLLYIVKVKYRFYRSFCSLNFSDVT